MGCKIFLTSPGETNLALNASIGRIARGAWPRSERMSSTDFEIRRKRKTSDKTKYAEFL
jgi:hypothetical protein